MGPTTIGRDKTHQFELSEAKRSLASLKLESVALGDYLVVMRSEFDAFIEGDPYVALMLMFNMDSGEFIARVWNETVTVGSVQRMEDFLQACKDHFHFKPCIGCPSIGDELEGYKYFQPKRRFSKGCHRFLKEKDTVSCPECLALTSPSTTVQCKVELSTEMECGGFLPKEEDKINPEVGFNRSEVYYQSDLDQAFADHDSYVGDSWSPGDNDIKDNVTEPSYDSDSYIDDSKDSDYKVDEGEENDEDQRKERRKKLARKRNTTGLKGKRKSSEINDIHLRKNGAFLKCPWCEMVFRKESSFIVHKRSEHFWGEFKCNQCSFISDFAKDLLDHIMGDEKHFEKPTAQCPKCEGELPIMEMETHYKNCAKDLMYKCEVCGHQCKGRDGINTHKKRKHLWGIFKCSERSCKYAARFAKDIIKHIQEKGHNNEVKCPTNGCSIILPASDIEAHYEKCINENIRSIARRANKKWNINRICDTCGNNVKKETYSHHVKRCKLKAERGDTQKQGDIESYCCEQCGMEFSGKYASARFSTHKKNNHLKEQARVSKHICSACFIVTCQYTVDISIMIIFCNQNKHFIASFQLINPAFKPYFRCVQYVDTAVALRLRLKDT